MSGFHWLATLPPPLVVPIEPEMPNHLLIPVPTAQPALKAVPSSGSLLSALSLGSRRPARAAR